MNKTELKKALESHKLWLIGEPKGKRADLRSADLRSADLRGANLGNADLRGANLGNADLRGANLRSADLRGANLSCANLRGANLSCANLRGANLRGANLREANLWGADLRSADLRNANLRGADLRNADLSCASLRDTDLKGADLTNAALNGANLSGAKGLLNPKEFLAKFKKDELGIIVYKGFGDTFYKPCDKWKIVNGEFIEEEVNYVRTNTCGCGINVASKKWVKKYCPDSVIWRCRIRWEDICTVVIPYNADGKFRCGRLELLKEVK